jgi:hypothetical protein
MMNRRGRALCCAATGQRLPVDPDKIHFNHLFSKSYHCFLNKGQLWQKYGPILTTRIAGKSL